VWAFPIQDEGDENWFFRRLQLVLLLPTHEAFLLPELAISSGGGGELLLR
jgi:hypothetical protein